MVVSPGAGASSEKEEPESPPRHPTVHHAEQPAPHHVVAHVEEQEGPKVDIAAALGGAGALNALDPAQIQTILALAEQLRANRRD